MKELIDWIVILSSIMCLFIMLVKSNMPRTCKIGAQIGYAILFTAIGAGLIIIYNGTYLGNLVEMIIK